LGLHLSDEERYDARLVVAVEVFGGDNVMEEGKGLGFFVEIVHFIKVKIQVGAVIFECYCACTSDGNKEERRLDNVVHDAADAAVAGDAGVVICDRGRLRLDVEGDGRSGALLATRGAITGRSKRSE